MLKTLLNYSRNGIGINQFNSKDLAQFYRIFKSYLRYICDTIGADINTFETDNYKISALVLRKDKTFVRISVDDVRRAKNFNSIVIRTIPEQDNGPT